MQQMKLENIELSFDNFASEMSKLKNQKHFDYLVTIIGEDFGEEGLGCIYILENTDNNEAASIYFLHPTSSAVFFACILIGVALGSMAVKYCREVLIVATSLIGGIMAGVSLAQLGNLADIPYGLGMSVGFAVLGMLIQFAINKPVSDEENEEPVDEENTEQIYRRNQELRQDQSFEQSQDRDREQLSGRINRKTRK